MIRSDIQETLLENTVPDGMTVFVMADGAFRGALLHGTRLVNQMRANHQLGILETMILGQGCLCSALTIPTMKGKERLNIRFETDGAATGFSVEADSAGTVRGYLLQNPVPVTKPLDSWDLSPFFGNSGTLTVSRFPEGRTEPQTGTVELIHKNIAQDLSWYFLQSEQIQTAFNTSIQMDKQGRVIGAGGMFLQRMPNTGGKTGDRLQDDAENEELAEAVEAAFAAAPPLGQWFSEKGDYDDIIYGLFREFNPHAVLNRSIAFDCPCSAEQYRAYIASLPPAEREALKAHNSEFVEVTCHNCNSTYRIPFTDLP